MADTERHGVDFRTPAGVTPLMAAAYACNVPLVEALLERGASREASDHLGRTAMHWVLRRAYVREEGLPALLGTTWDLVAPASFDVDVDGRRVQIGREQAEFFVFAVRADGAEAWRPILEVLNAAWLDAQLMPKAHGRPSRVPLPGPSGDLAQTSPVLDAAVDAKTA